MLGRYGGNTATMTTMRNEVASTGTGVAQSLTAYATLPSAKYTPASCNDTVTVNLNF